MPDYEVQHYLLTPEEVGIYNKINNVIADDECCCIKVTASAILRPVSSTDEAQYLRLSHAIANKYFDFLICEKYSLQPRLAILINQNNEHHKNKQLLNAHQENDLSHNNFNLHENDTDTMSHAVLTVEQIKMLKQSCDEAGLPCIFISSDTLSNPQTLQDTIAPYVNNYA